VAEVDLNVICKHCGAEVSPYITECPYCGERLRKRAPKLKRGVEQELEPRPRRLRLGRKRRAAQQTETVERPLAWLATDRPYATIALLLGLAGVYIAEQASELSTFDFGAVIGPLDGDWWRLGAAQFVHENVGYLLAVGITVAIFGTSIERRYGWVVPLVLFALPGAAGLYLATLIEATPIALGANGSALGLLCAWLVRDLRDRRDGYDTESDLLGVAVIGVVLTLMPLLETTANAWVALGGVAAGAVLGLALPAKR
jgi:membrane associated rhomboid family serine protease